MTWIFNLHFGHSVLGLHDLLTKFCMARPHCFDLRPREDWPTALGEASYTPGQLLVGCGNGAIWLLDFGLGLPAFRFASLGPKP